MRQAILDFWNEPRSPAVDDAKMGLAPFAGLVVFAVIAALFEPEGSRLTACLMGVGMALALRWHRTHSFWITMSFLATTLLIDYLPWVTSALVFTIAIFPMTLFGMYSVTRWASGREVAIAVVATVVVLVFSLKARPADLPEEAIVILHWPTFMAFLSLWLMPVAIGRMVRVQAHERHRTLAAARLGERHLIARELHDSVAHHVSAIAIQAQAARALGRTKPETTAAIIETIEEQAARTLDEMRRMVSVLRDNDEAAELRPQAALADIADLASFGDLGPAVDVTLEGRLEHLSPSTEASLYRFAQEGVTNAVRHARHATRVRVKITGYDDHVDLKITDDGDPVSRTAPPGFGLTGMAERATQLGGTIFAGPSTTRGWTIEASLPVVQPSP